MDPHSNDSDDFSQWGLDASLPSLPPARLGKLIPPPPLDPFGRTYVKDYEEQDIQERLAALDVDPELKVLELDVATQQRLEDLHHLERADQSRLWAASRDSLRWSVLDLLPSRWERVTTEIRFLDEKNLWHPDHMWLTDRLREEKFQAWVESSRVWLIALQPWLPGQPSAPILVESEVPPSPGDQLSLTSFHTFWECTPKGEKPEAELTLTVLWPAFRLSQENWEAVVLGAIHDRGMFIALEESVMAFSPKE